MASETKKDDNFPESQFSIKGFSKPFRLERTAKRGETLFCIREDITCRYIKQITLNNSFIGFFVELNLRSKKWLLGYSNNH